MATRSSITIKNSDGSKRSIYCHWDGYPDHVGKILNEHYNTTEKVNALIDLGAISVLAPSIECPEGHSFESPVRDYTIAYHRDRGDELMIFDKVQREDYNYLFDVKTQKWTYSRD